MENITYILWWFGVCHVLHKKEIEELVFEIDRMGNWTRKVILIYIQPRNEYSVFITHSIPFKSKTCL